MKIKKYLSDVVKSLAFASLALSSMAPIAEAAVDRSETLIIYSNSVSDGRGEWLTEKAKEAGFNIEMVDVPGAELADRVIAEKNNGIADMVYGINAVDSNKLKFEDILTPFSPTWLDKIDSSLADDEGYFNPVFVQPLVLIGNQGVEMPKDWTELGSKYSGKYAISSLTGGTPRMILASILVRYLDENGELGVSEEGWKVVEDYIQNAYILQKGERAIVKMLDTNDPTDYGMMWGSGALQGQKEFNVEFQFMNPEIGVPFVTEQTMILKSSKKQELAQEFINWFGSEEVMTEYNSQFGSIPANKDSVKNLALDAQKLLDSVHQQEIDWAVVGEYLDLWVEKVELEFVK